MESASTNTVQFTVEEHWMKSVGAVSGFEQEKFPHNNAVYPVYNRGIFNAASFIRHVYKVFTNVEGPHQEHFLSAGSFFK
jgi:hypothetical protein